MFWFTYNIVIHVMLYIIIFSIVAPQILLSSKTKLAEEKQNVSSACTATG